MGKLENKICLVTGAGRGIGRAIALRLAAGGAQVVLTARSEDQLQSVCREIEAAGGTAFCVAADITDEAPVQSLFETVKERCGRLDVLVNNAGLGIYGPLADFAAEDFDRVMNVNVRGTFLCCRAAMQMMMPRRAGYIINISSVVGFKGYPEQSAYTASKHAMMGLTKSLAVEAQEYGIRVSAVLPGGVDTEMVAQSRPDLDRSVLMKPDDVAQAVEYLLSLSEHAAVDEIYIRRAASKPF